MDLKSLQLGFQGSSDKKWVKVWKQKKKKYRNNQMFSWGIFEKVYTEWCETQHHVLIWPITFKKIVMK